MSRYEDKDAVRKWQDYFKNHKKSSAVLVDEDPAEKEKRKIYLLSDFVAFAKYYFPKYASSEFSSFHKKSVKLIIDNPTIYIAEEWSRDHAKSVVHGLMLPLFLKFNGQLKNMLMVSWSSDNAKELLAPLKKELETNQRIINDFGVQVGLGTWEADKFVTSDGCSFRSLGAGQSPRGTRNEEARPDFILCDDLDHDEVVLNKKRLDKTWDWMTGALYGCLSIDGAKRFVVINNRIGKDCLLGRAIQQADYHIRVDILRKTKRCLKADLTRVKQLLKNETDTAKIRLYKNAIGWLQNNYAPSWHERFDILDCVYMIDKMGYILSQKEYFNNPILEGNIFKSEWIQYGAMPNLNKCNYKLTYLDPGFKKTKTSDSKSWILMALHQGIYYVYKVFCGKATINEMIEWGYALDDYIKEKDASCTHYMEEVFLQDLLYDDFNRVAKHKNRPLGVRGDKRKKPNKDDRIVSLTGTFERGQIIFNEKEKDNHHMKELINQFLGYDPTSSNVKKDGPDALEGAKHLLEKMIVDASGIQVGNRTTNPKKL